MKAPICPESSASRHFGNHEINNFPPNLLPQEPKRTPVTLTAPGKPAHNYNLTDEQMRLLNELVDKGLTCAGFTATIHDMTCFQNL